MDIGRRELVKGYLFMNKVSSIYFDLGELNIKYVMGKKSLKCISK